MTYSILLILAMIADDRCDNCEYYRIPTTDQCIPWSADTALVRQKFIDAGYSFTVNDSAIKEVGYLTPPFATAKLLERDSSIVTVTVWIKKNQIEMIRNRYVPFDHYNERIAGQLERFKYAIPISDESLDEETQSAYSFPCENRKYVLVIFTYNPYVGYDKNKERASYSEIICYETLKSKKAKKKK